MLSNANALAQLVSSASDRSPAVILVPEAVMAAQEPLFGVGPPYHVAGRRHAIADQ